MHILYNDQCSQDTEHSHQPPKDPHALLQLILLSTPSPSYFHFYPFLEFYKIAIIDFGSRWRSRYQSSHRHIEFPDIFRHNVKQIILADF